MMKNPNDSPLLNISERDGFCFADECCDPVSPLVQCDGGSSHSLSNHFHLQPGNAENSSQIKRAEAQMGSQISRLSRISAAQP